MDLVTRGLVEGFQQDQDLTRLNNSEAFEAFAAYCVLNAYYDAEFNPDLFRAGGGNDLSVDAYGVMVNGELLRDATDVQATVEQARRLDVQFIVIQAKTTSGFDTHVISDFADNLCHIFDTHELPYAASEDVENLRGCVAAIYQNVAKLSGRLPKLHIHYVTTGEQVADMVARKASSAQRRLTGLDRFDEVEFRCVTRRDLRMMYQRATTAVTATVSMPKRVALPRQPGVLQSFHGLMAAKDLVRVVLDDGSGYLRQSLFNDNVRDFQGYNDVNTAIRHTLRDPVRRERFAVLNNGITIVTRGLSAVGDDFVLRDFQIVNGCQTCHVLFHERDQLTDAVYIKIHIVHSEDEDVINGIIEATNRQTTISDDDLSAREDFHKQLEDYFTLGREKQHRLYYERRSKQYSERKDIEKTRVISRAQLVRAYFALFLNEPARVGHYKELVGTRGQEIFVNGQPLVLYYTAAATSYRLDWLFRNRRIPTSYGPTRYHLLAAIRLRLLGDTPLPQSRKAVERECDRILKVMWDPMASERIVVDLLQPLGRVIEVERQAGVPLGEMVRNQRFAEHVRREILSRSAK